ncbi:MAG: GHMP kinase [Flavobacterium sp.]|uniref:GYDIA family GHMP kinase n=1 Tax=Flavobacterium sp. TaxID=239 RepID=UPI001D40DBCD|nr:GHMP kinase [Flavobacterium sp.]
MKQTFYSNGKLLLTGEYVVLDGALALALPTKFGQYLTVEPISSKQIQWKSFDQDGSIWFDDTFTFNEITHKTFSSENSVRNTLLEILHEAYQMKPDFLLNKNGFNIETNLTFQKNWGLGTSSTLINNIGDWLEIDAFELLNKSFGGSGYDIACAQNNAPIIYQLIDNKPFYRKVDFSPNFRDHLFFVYLNKKQSSKSAIANYINKQNEVGKTIEQINKITKSLLSNNDLRTFVYEIEKHENLLSDVLEISTIKEAFFDDFKGVVKSLGAWGGDFVLVVSKNNPTGYFKERGFETLLCYDEMILK